MAATTALLLAVLVQFVTERVKAVIPEGNPLRSALAPIIAMVISLILTITCSVGLLSTLGIETNPVWVDYILTGLIISGGSTAVNELIKVMSGIKAGLQKNMQ